MFDGFIPSDEVKHNGLWLSLVERSVRDREVAGSNPVNPTIFLIISELPPFLPQNKCFGTQSGKKCV